MGKVIKLSAILIAIVAALAFSACSPLVHRPDDIFPKLDVPSGMQAADEDSDIMKESSCVLKVTDDSGSATLGGEKLGGDALAAKIASMIEGKTPDKRIVYIQGAAGLQYRTIVNLAAMIRKADIDKVGLVVQKSTDIGDPRPHEFTIRLVQELASPLRPLARPNPLMLVAMLDKSGKLMLNNEPTGSLTDPDPLSAKLRQIFKERESNGVFREDSNEVEKTTWVKAPLSARYADVCRLIDTVKLGGGSPIGLQIDTLAE